MDHKFDTIFTEIKKSYDWLIEVQHWLHQHPELLFKEIQTSKYIQEELTKLSIPFTTGWGNTVDADGKPIGGTGIVAEIGTFKSPCIGLRADIDGLPVPEKTGLPHASTTGKMHACGHDAHTTALLGAAKYLKAHEAEIEGTIRLIFQPAEEGGAGAKFMIEEGCLTKDPPVQLMLGQHTASSFHTGEVWSKSGAIMATANHFSIFIYGKGGHASRPHECKDAVSTAVAIIQNINTFVSRFTSAVDPKEAGVISVTCIKTQEAYNVLPSKVEIRGTMRALCDEKMTFFKEKTKTLAEKTAEAFGLTAEYQACDETYPVTTNHPKLHGWCEKLLANTMVKNGLQSMSLPVMGSEDFSYFGLKVPSCYLLLGSTAPGKVGHSHHSDLFEIDPECLLWGATLMAYVGSQCLRRLKTESITL